MADGSQLVLCSPLCFLVKKYCQTQAKILKSALLDFYDGDTLSKAKQRLLTDFSNIKQQVGIDSVPHIPQRRDGDNRAQREVDDMFTVLNILDEHLLLNKLPIYVCDGPDKMPATRLYEGDFSVIMTILEKLEGKLATVGSAVSAISRDVYILQSKSKSTDCAGQSDVVNKESLAQCVNTVLNLDTLESRQAWPTLPVRDIVNNVQPVMTSSGDSSARAPIGSCTETTVRKKPCDGQPSLRSDKQWSVLASTPQGSNNRFAVLASIDDEVNDDDRSMTVVRSQRSIRASAKRRRQQSAEAQQAERQSSQPGRLKSRGVTGQSATVSSSIWAAKKTIKKAVLCVDNVDLACNEDDIRAYVSSLGAQVFTCFKTNPRRRPNESAEDVNDRRAFRLCVNAADRDRLLNPVVWPDSIRISDWFFSSKNNQQSNDNAGKRQRIERSGEPGPTVSLSGSVGINSVNNVCVSNPSDNDGNTGVARETATTASASATVVATEEAMAIGTTSNDVRDVYDDTDADNDVDRTTIYQHGVC